MLVLFPTDENNLQTKSNNILYNFLDICPLALVGGCGNWTFFRNFIGIHQRKTPAGECLIVLFHNYFSPSGEQLEQRILTCKSEQPTAGCIARLFYKYCCYIKHGGYYNKFDYEILGGRLLIIHVYFKIPQCRYMEHELEYIAFYVQKQMPPLACVCPQARSPTGLRRAARGARICEICLFTGDIMLT